MMAWFAASRLGLPRVIWGIMILTAVVGALMYAGAIKRASDKRNQDIGATAEREKSSSVVIENAEKANAARDEIRSNNSGARYDQCLRTARTPANCERFLR